MTRGRKRGETKLVEDWREIKGKNEKERVRERNNVRKPGLKTERQRKLRNIEKRRKREKNPLPPSRIGFGFHHLLLLQRRKEEKRKLGK